jgi:hypothetical protein
MSASRAGRLNPVEPANLIVAARSPYALDRLMVWVVRAPTAGRIFRPLFGQN